MNDRLSTKKDPPHRAAMNAPKRTLSAAAACLAASLFLAEGAAAQHLNLGGGCASSLLPSFPGNDQLSFTTGLQGPAGTLVLDIDTTIPSTISDFWTPVLIGFSDPNALLPSCGCTLHTTGEVVTTNTTLQVLYPASAVGLQVTVQAVVFLILWPGPQAVPYPNGCTEPGFSVAFSDGYWVTL